MAPFGDRQFSKLLPYQLGDLSTNLAPVPGLEPGSSVLETEVLPLNDTDKLGGR